MTKLGQHFLARKTAVDKIVSALDLSKKDIVIEVGPGHGELTGPLLEKLRGLDGRLIVIEKDRALAAGLLKRFPARADFSVVTGDALKKLPDLLKKEGGAKLAGNLPYYITGQFFRILSESDFKPKLAVVMIQREVAERICAKPPRMNRLAAIIQYFAEPKIILKLAPGDFRPAPRVDSAILFLKIKNGSRPEEMKKHYKAAHALFQQPRKNILNNLAPLRLGTKAELSGKLSKAGINPLSRPQYLDLEQVRAVCGLMDG